MNPWPNNWNAIRAHYETMTPLILATPKDEWAIDPYQWDTGIITMTPIECWLWSDIRNLGLVMYPQYPVGRYFVDFANPRARVAIECDGAEFHTDKAKDAARQRDIEALGWTVHRLDGWECRDEWTAEHGPGRAERVLSALADMHGLRRQSEGVTETMATSIQKMLDRMFEAVDAHDARRGD